MNGLSIRPNPNLLFGSGLSTLFYYVEAYNLDAGIADTSYTLLSFISESTRSGPARAVGSRIHFFDFRVAFTPVPQRVQVGEYEIRGEATHVEAIQFAADHGEGVRKCESQRELCSRAVRGVGGQRVHRLETEQPEPDLRAESALPDHFERLVAEIDLDSPQPIAVSRATTRTVPRRRWRDELDQAVIPADQLAL